MEHLPEASRRYHNKIVHQMKDLFHVEDMRGVEVFTSLARIVQIAENLDTQPSDEGLPISGARWRLLLHLFLSEQIGLSDGVTPTELSQFQQVSKNTVSSLLRGLEEQGCILRALDPKDLRVFRIRLTETGRQIILDTAPARIEGFNRMLICLNEEEISQLTSLLKKVHYALESQVCQQQKVSARPD